MAVITIIIPPKLEPVTLSEAKEKLAILHEDEDARILRLIQSGREFAENYCGITIMTTVVELALDWFPPGHIELNTWPLQSVDSIRYESPNTPGTIITLVPDMDYYVDILTEGGVVFPIKGWPSVASKPNAVRIQMTAGYDSLERVPELIKSGIKAHVVYEYDDDPIMEKSAKSILWPKRLL